MAILSKEDFLNRIKEITKDKTDDDTLKLVEDMTDTINNYENDKSQNWKEKYETNDKEWRERYKARFFSGDTHEDDDDEPEDDKPKTYTFDNLFKEEK